MQMSNVDSIDQCYTERISDTVHLNIINGKINMINGSQQSTTMCIHTKCLIDLRRRYMDQIRADGNSIS